MKVEVSTPVKRSGRVRQVEGMFDVPPAERQHLEWDVPDELPKEIEHGGWKVGLIVGPSGSGKTVTSRLLFGERLIEGFDWPVDRALVDSIDGPIKDVVGMLTSVGFGSPPAWLRPFHVLSMGEQFRATMARALIERSFVAMDEFTSVVDRQVARVGSHAVAKAVRRSEGSQLVAVTCHHDVIEWLQPDWVYAPATGEFTRRSLQRRPAVELEVRRVSRDAWAVFRRHHYLSADLHVAANCVGGFVGEECVAFNAYYKFPHPKAKNIMVSSRTVVLPDWQGLGIGGRLTEFVGEMLHREGLRYRATLAHPALIAYRRHSARWREVDAKNMPSRSRKPKRLNKQHASPRKLATRTFEYVPVEG